MNNKAPYNKYQLTKEMLETPKVASEIDIKKIKDLAKLIPSKSKFLITGEGSSRIFPAKRLIGDLLQENLAVHIFTEGATQALDYNLNEVCVMGASNSGKTKEVVELFRKLTSQNNLNYFGLTATSGSPVATMPKASFVLNCGKEEAVAATKSVVEQALYYQLLFGVLFNTSTPDLQALSEKMKEVLTCEIDKFILEKCSKAKVLYFSGRNNGVAEELTLKTNEITRKKSDFLEGTYLVHGIEEVMTSKEVVVLIDPFPQEEEKIKECLVEGIGMEVIAIAHQPTSFPTILLPQVDKGNEYLQLLAGWSLLVEVGLDLKINLDQPVRARKVGNEVK